MGGAHAQWASAPSGKQSITRGWHLLACNRRPGLYVRELRLGQWLTATAASSLSETGRDHGRDIEEPVFRRGDHRFVLRHRLRRDSPRLQRPDDVLLFVVKLRPSHAMNNDITQLPDFVE